MIASITGTFLLTQKSWQHSPANQVVATAVFGFSAIFLFATSSLYHFLYDGFQMSKPLEEWFEKIDHIAILLFISGTYTALLMNSVSPIWANRLLVIIWCLASIGILYTLLRERLPRWAQHRFTYTAFYVLMGWVFAIRFGEIFHALSVSAFRGLILGGVSYSVGAVVYATRWPNLIKNVFGFHELWHAFVVLGFAFHYVLISGFYS